MFGTVVPLLEKLSPEESQRYRAVYCGLCHALGERAGQPARLGLTYDMAFLAILLSSLYEPIEHSTAARCPPHLIRPQVQAHNEYIDYGADMTVALIYHKCLDDWTDDRNLSARGYAAWLKSHYKAVRQIWPRQCLAIEYHLGELARAEVGGPPDQTMNCFGDLLGEIFVYRQQDIWERPLRQFGRALGRFVYWMDAALDYEEDRKTGSYNPLLHMNQTPWEMREPLTVLIGQAAAIFERLPLEQDVHLMRNILYMGVWQRYLTAVQPPERSEEHGAGPIQSFGRS